MDVPLRRGDLADPAGRRRSGAAGVAGALAWRSRLVLRPGNEIRSDSRPPTVGRHTIVYGDIRLTLDYDHSTRGAAVNGSTLTLGEHNVIFVDEVDGPSGPRVVRTFRVAPEMPGSAGQLSPLLTRSPEIMTFLRCDAPIPADKPRLILERLCLTNLGVPR